MRPMQSMFRRSSRGVPSLNMASMPDLIFTVLFFFMIVTHMRNDEVKVRYQVPQGRQIQKLASSPSVVNIYIGRQNGKGDWQIQMNGDLVTASEIPARLDSLTSHHSPSTIHLPPFTISLRADRHTPMGIISDVKEALRQSYALKINYNATDINSNNDL